MDRLGLGERGGDLDLEDLVTTRVAAVGADDVGYVAVVVHLVFRRLAVAVLEVGLVGEDD